MGDHLTIARAMAVVCSENVMFSNKFGEVSLDIYQVVVSNRFYYYPYLGEMIQFDQYPSHGLVQPPTRKHLWMFRCVFFKTEHDRTLKDEINLSISGLAKYHQPPSFYKKESNSSYLKRCSS